MAIKIVAKMPPDYLASTQRRLETVRAEALLSLTKIKVSQQSSVDLVGQYAYAPIPALDIESEIINRIARRNKVKPTQVKTKSQLKEIEKRHQGLDHQYRTKRQNELNELLRADKRLTDFLEFLETAYPNSQVEPIIFNVHILPELGLFIYENSVSGYPWLYQDVFYEVTNTSYDYEEQKLLVLEFADKERQKFERLAAKFSKEQTEHVKYERTRIPENVRIEVWRRDQGKCAGCGSREKLEYDHIVPVIRGGSNTARNVELLCEACNRSKGDRIR